MEFVATCLFGLEKFVGEEIDALGYKRLSTIDGRVTFEGPLSAIAACNIHLRTAERIFIKLGSFFVGGEDAFDRLFEGTRALPFEEFIGHSVKSRLTSIPACQGVVQKAIAKRLEKAYHKSWFEGGGVTYPVEFFILNDEATLMIDTTGVALHKRGYRPASNAAPLRETLAAALCKIARPREDVLFWDPMCGSGTIAIEAAMMMMGIAPGLKRSFATRFAFLLSIPAVLGSFVLELVKALFNGVNWALFPVYLVGMIFAGVVGYFAIGLMRRFVERCKLTYFSYYCWGVGALVLIISMFL